MQTIMNSAVWLALIAALCYGLGGPMMKLAGQAGATPSGLAFMYGMGALLATVNWWGKQTVLFTSTHAAVLALIMGLMFGIAFRSIGRAFTLPTGHLSIVLIVVASYPILSSIIGLIFLGEASKVVLPKLILGTLLVIVGVCIVATSAKAVP